MFKRLLVMGSASAFISIALGAFGAHALKERLTEEVLATYHTGVEYQMYHAIALILTALIALHVNEKGARSLKWAGIFFVAGTILFSGSLYAYSLSGIASFGIIAPFGGVSFLLGWVNLLLSAKNLAKRYE